MTGLDRMSKLKSTKLMVDDDPDVLYTVKCILKLKFENVILAAKPEYLLNH
jgi:hypothetical protein